jgi:Na+-transporting methylmalonyl-CoA/oxaloacetate decarboxylase gamma subunit
MENLGFGLQTTAIGMSLVFGLLALLWLLLTAVLHFDRAPGAASPAEVAAPAPAQVQLGAVSAPADLEPELVAAIMIAVRAHVEDQRLQAAPAMRIYWPGSLLHASRWVAAGRTRQNRSWGRGGKVGR